MSTHQQPSQSEIPAELWMLWSHDAGNWIGDADTESPSGCVVCFSEREAREFCSYLKDNGYIHAIPMRVK